MKLLANENFPLTSVKILEKNGYDTKYIGTDSPGITDAEVMDIAIREERTILTFDRDYGELIFKKAFRPAKGVIYLRWSEFQPSQPGEYLTFLFNLNTLEFDMKLTVISENTIRQRKYD